MELVEGPTLADRIAKGAIPLDEALPIAKQIAEGLEAAHEQGIVHRDLKPANIKVRPDGTVKVLDFGLAKALAVATDAAELPQLSHSQTVAGVAGMTGMGVLLGTAAYMAPEQAKGKEVDRRADIWAFGCVLYEMLTGKRAFEGESLSDIVAAVLGIACELSWLPSPAATPSDSAATSWNCNSRSSGSSPPCCATTTQHNGGMRHSTAFGGPRPARSVLKKWR